MYVGKEVILSGEITSSPDPVKYSYILKLATNEQVGLVSTRTAIANYNGKVSVKGTVKSYDNSMYVIDVSFITTDTTASLGDVNASKTYVPDANLLIDTTGNPTAIAVTIANNTITINDTASSVSGDTITVTYFTCQKSDPLKDCEQIKASAKAGDQFTSTQGLTFYKIAEASKWFAQSDSMGYMVDVPKDAFFYKVSSYFFPLNTKYIQARIQTQAANYCYNVNSRLSTISKQTTTSKGNVWTTVVEGVDTDGRKVTCTLDMTFNDHQEMMSMTSYIVSSDAGVNVATGNNTTPTGSTAGTTPTPTKVGGVPGPTSTGYLFISNRGNYSIFFPSQKIAFEGVNLTETFGLEKTTCYVDIQVKSYADRENTSVMPGVEIYECVTKLTADEIKAKLPNYMVVESADTTKMFIVKTNAESWAAFSAGIVIQ
ncbi:hypothetical protein KBC03_06430 [Patescibacteria group bacterium]|nr:hypothetical protein [Patescibacteria group bacterium]